MLTISALILAHGQHDETLLFTAGPIVAGLLAGLVHVLTGPDHIAAVAPLAVDHPQRSWWAGCVWGIGHSGGIWLLAALALVLRETLPIDAISAWSERLVGIVLIAVGLWGLRRISRMRIHDHPHRHITPNGNEHIHSHPHVHPDPIDSLTVHQKAPHRHGHSLIGIGLLHGLAGTAHLLGVLPALAMPNRAAAVAYVLAFGIGSIGGMGLVAEGIGRIARAAHRQNHVGLMRGMMATCSISAVALGIFWLT